jgi:flavin reductase (DIM6/NTAB) family NADH-FMN oxidoreductase RutF
MVWEIKHYKKEQFMKKQLGPSDVIFPVPAALIVSGINEDANIITIARIGIPTPTPPTIGISVKNSRYSLGLIRKTGEFSVNIPPASLFKAVDYCGMATGRKRNKFEDVGFTPVESLKIKPPIIKECPYNIECKVMHDVMIGDWALILGEIVETHIDEDKADASKHMGVDISKINPLVYCARVREYWTMGNMLGFGLQAGKEIKEKLEET